MRVKSNSLPWASGVMEFGFEKVLEIPIDVQVRDSLLGTDKARQKVDDGVNHRFPFLS